MTDSTNLKERIIRATIEESAISRVPSFFNADLDDILNETLQNARRSQATVVHITTDSSSVSIADDGAGIPDPRLILSFGGSEWNQHETRDEHPAGMGIYALARLDPVTVTSKNDGEPAWRVRLTPSHFKGEEDAYVEDADDNLFPAGHGTIITFDWHVPDERHIKETTKHYPIPTFHNGRTLPQQDFLHEAEHIEEWEGLRIGVVHINGPFSPGQTGQINFHGIGVRPRQLTELVTTVSPQRTYGACVDVVHCPQLELTLPNRRSVINTPFLDQAKQALLRAVYTTIAQDPEQPGVPWQRQQEARNMGINIPDPKARLPVWEPTERSEEDYEPRPRWRPATAECLIVSEDLEIPEQHTLALAIENTTEAPQLLREQDETFTGYPWYDEIPRITGLHADLHYGDDIVQMTKGANQRPDAISVKAEIRHPDGTTGLLAMKSPAAFPDDAETSLDYLRPVVAKDSDLDSQQMADILKAVYFRYSDDFDSDSHETQQDWAEETLLRNMQSLLESREKAVRGAVNYALLGTGIHRLPVGTRVIITVLEDEHYQTEIETPVPEHQPHEA